MVQRRLWIAAAFAAPLIALSSIEQYTNAWGALALAVLVIGFAVLVHAVDLGAILPRGVRPVLNREDGETSSQ
jgi:peptidoglycan/LPS O-acetylase OafA/YrhL